MKCPNCGYEFEPLPPPYSKRLHWPYPRSHTPLCRVDKRGLYHLTSVLDDVTCQNCLKEIALRQQRGLDIR